MPARMPIGVLMSVATSTIMHAAEDRVEQAAVGARRRRHLVNSARRQRREARRANSVNRIHSRNIMPNAMVAERHREIEAIDAAAARR